MYIKYILVYTLQMGPYTMPYDIMTCNRITHYRILEHSGLLEHTGTYLHLYDHHGMSCFIRNSAWFRTEMLSLN